MIDEHVGKSVFLRRLGSYVTARATLGTLHQRVPLYYTVEGSCLVLRQQGLRNLACNVDVGRLFIDAAEQPPVRL